MTPLTLNQSRAPLQPGVRGQLAAGLRHAANDVAHSGGDLQAVQVQLGELVLQTALAHRRQRGMLHAHAARAHEFDGIEIDLLVSTRLVGANPGSIPGASLAGGGSGGDAGRRGLHRDQLRRIASRQRLRVIRQRCTEQRTLTAHQLINALDQRGPFSARQIEAAAQVEQRCLTDEPTRAVCTGR